MATVIISILFVAALRLFANLGRSRQVSLDRNSAQMLALEMIEEIKNLPYKDLSVPGNPIGPEADEIGPTRLLFDDIDDFNGWIAHPPMTRQGNPYTQHLNLSREVAVVYVSADDFEQPVETDEGFKEITITIKDQNTGVILIRQKYVIANISLPIP
ncbi:MAG: hypothetical protein JW860_07360 [Sedimentisphaerales bacterium]|nr:hypothetical protein [Sedimentisphaerales bacterium]